MAHDRERILTLGLLALVGAAGAWSLWPRPVARGPVALEEPPIVVSVSGEVRRPGVYTLPHGSRVGAALEAAGGLAPGAEDSLVNPAGRLEDGDALRVPGRAAGGEGGGAGAAPAERVNVNTATPAELEALPGVGPALAKRLVEGRPYASMADLDRVKGIGPKLLEKLTPLVRF